MKVKETGHFKEKFDFKATLEFSKVTLSHTAPTFYNYPAVFVCFYAVQQSKETVPTSKQTCPFKIQIPK